MDRDVYQLRDCFEDNARFVWHYAASLQALGMASSTIDTRMKNLSYILMFVAASTSCVAQLKAAIQLRDLGKSIVAAGSVKPQRVNLDKYLDCEKTMARLVELVDTTVDRLRSPGYEMTYEDAETVRYLAVLCSQTIFLGGPRPMQARFLSKLFLYYL